MPVLPAVAHQVHSAAIPTPQRIVMGGHPGFAGATVPIESQVFGLVLPRQGHPYPRAVAGASHADAVRLGIRPKRKASHGRFITPCRWSVTQQRWICPPGERLSIAGAARPSKGMQIKNPFPLAGKSHADAVRLASGAGVAGGNKPPSYPDYPGNVQRSDRRARRAMAGSMFPPSYPDYPGKQAGRGAASRKRAGIAGFAGHCCESCAHGGPCEGCDGHGGCGKPNCGCL